MLATNNLFRMRVLCVSLLAICFACGLAFSAAPMHRQDQVTQQTTKPFAIDLDAATLNSYQGQYATDANPDVVYSFFYEDAKFFVESARSPRTYLLAKSKTGFFVKGARTEFNFVTDPGGKVTGVTIGAGNNSRLAKRISDHPVPNNFRPYARQEVMIPMRDGVKLFAVVLRPTDTNAPLPFILDRTPYGVSDNDANNISPQLPELAVSGYIFVFEDIRGRYKSEGKFTMMHPLADHKDPKQTDESTDAYDSVAWLIKNIPNNNGRVGVVGTSYPGFLTAEAGIDAHPAVKAISPQAPMTDVWMGDDFFHNGAFRESYGFDYVQQMEAPKTDARVDKKQDTYDFFLQHRNFAGAAAAAKMSDLPTAKAFLTQPAYTKFWQDMAVER